VQSREVLRVLRYRQSWSSCAPWLKTVCKRSPCRLV